MTTTERTNQKTTDKAEAAAAARVAALHPNRSKNPLKAIERHPFASFAAGIVTLLIGAVAWPFALIVSATAGVAVPVVIATATGFIVTAVAPFLIMIPFPTVVRAIRSKFLR